VTVLTLPHHHGADLAVECVAALPSYHPWQVRYAIPFGLNVENQGGEGTEKGQVVGAACNPSPSPNPSPCPNPCPNPSPNPSPAPTPNPTPAPAPAPTPTLTLASLP